MKENIEAIYQLSPTQEGMLFHALFEPESGLYLLQFTCTLRGSFDREAFQGAWQKVYDRHAALRTIFHGEGLEKPVQVVLRRVKLVWEELDWRGVPPAEQKSRWQEMLRIGRESGLDLSRPPLTRLIVARTADDVWLFAWFVPHLLIDGWCLPLLLREVFAFYAGLCRGEEVRFERSRPYRDYIVWLLRQDLGEAESFWRLLLAGFEVPTPLPIDRLGPRPAGSGVGYGYVEKGVSLTTEATARLAAMARRYQLTANTLVQGAWALLLSRYSGERDLVFGSTVSGRSAPLPGIESMIGLFINTLPARTEIDGESLLLPWLRRLQAQQAEMRQYEYSPLVQVQGWSGVPRGVPLFKSILVFENYPVDPATERGVQAALPLAIHEVKTFAKTNYALTVLARMGERMALHVKHEIGRFDASTAERLLGHLEQLLLAMAGNPMQRLRALSPLSSAERHQLLIEENDTLVAARPLGRTLHELFEARVAQGPESVAVVDGTVELTYAELERQANRLAWHLLAMGVGPGCSVAVYLDRRWEMIPTLLGILKTGAAYVPLEITYPKTRVQWILSALDVPCVISQRSQAGLLEEILPELRGLRQVVLAEDWAGLASLPEDAPPPAAGLEDLAYTIFTSGSTGTPKGVQVLHRAAVHLVEWVNESFGVGPADRVLFVTSLCFDLSVYDVFGLLAAGGSIRIASTPEMRDPVRLVRALFTEPITFWDSAPAFLQQLALIFEAEPAPAETALRRVFLSGDWIPVALPDQVRSVFRGARMIALGGATEATVWSNWFAIEEVPPHWVSIPYGRPMWNSRYYVLDDRLEPCPIGIPGDLYIAGECLASGYAAEPMLTAGKFIPAPHSDESGGRMYWTGDRARHRLDGSLEFLGRLDHQVKIRGFRIELGEVESALEQHPAVRSTVALAREDEPGRRRLVAYYILSGEEPAPAAEEMRRFAAERLPEYMVPSAFVALDAFPVTANGKLDRRALPAPGEAQAKARQTMVEPRTETERTLARIWSEVLRVERLGISDNFFELGGDSILSIQIVSRAGREGISILPRHLFEHPTIAGLAVIAGQGGGAFTAEEPNGGNVPLTPSQRWLFEQDLDDPHHFNQALLLEVAERIDPMLLDGALNRAAEHHDAFRLRFHHGQHGWEQRYAEGETVAEMLVCDLAALPAGRRGEALRESATRIQAGFDLGWGPLLRAVLFRLTEDEPERLLLVGHHLVVDAVSWRIFLEDVETCYRDLERGAVPSLPRTTSFGEWARALAAHARSETVRRELAWWLAGAGAPRPLPIDRPDGHNGFDSLAHVSVSLSAEETRALLQEVPEVYRTRIDEVLLTALAQAVTEWTGSGQVFFEMERHGREEILPGLNLTRTVGWFTAFAPLRLEVELDSPSAALRAVKEQVRSMPGRGLGYGLLRYQGEETDAEALRALPEAEISFNYLGQLDQALPATSRFRAARESAGEGRSRRQRRRHLLDVSAHVAGGALRAWFAYSPNLHEPATAERLARRFLSRLRALIEHCLDETEGAFTPSDFPELRLTEPGFDRLLQRIGSDLGTGCPGPRSRRIEWISALSPAQEGMLFHTLYEPQSGVYCFQMSCSLEGELDVAAFRAAWGHVVERHSILRSSFHWDGLDRPVQVVHRTVELPWGDEDWSGLPEEERRERLARLRREDLQRGFEISRAPLLRLTLIRATPEVHHFVWTCHHLLVDGWSLTMVVQELFLMYRDLREGGSPQLEPVRPFHDYLSWLHRQDHSGAEAFWRGALASFTTPSPLDLSCARRPDPELKEGAGRLASRLPQGLGVGLQALARRHGLTLNTLVQGAWALVIGRYNGSEDVVFGTAVSGRPPELPGVERTVGPFLNTLPVRVPLNPGAEILPWLAALQQHNVEMRQFEFTPLVQIQGWSGLAPATPLFDTLLVFDRYPTVATAGQGSDRLRVRTLEAREQTNYSWSLAFSGSFEIDLLFDPDRFDPADVRRVLGYFENGLAGFAHDPHRRLGEVELLGEAERQQLLVESNDTSAVPGGWDNTCLHRLFEEQAVRTPDAPALIVDEETLTYGDLDRRSGKLAEHLRTLGVGPEVTVGLCLGRVPELVVGLLAVLRAGGAYVPLDPGQPVERLSWMLENSGVLLLLAGDGTPAELFKLPIPTVSAAVEPPPGKAPDEPVPPLPLNLGYVIYTSGSTGRPKGVQVHHRALVSHCRAMVARYGLGPRDRVLQFAPIAFDLAVEEIFPAWASGACVVLRPEGPAPSFAELSAWVERHGVTVLSLPTSYWHEWVDDLDRNRRRAPESVRLVVVGTEQALPERVEAWRRIAGGVRWVNAYGTSETTITSTTWEADDDSRHSVVPVGRPIANARVYLLDRALRHTPQGGVGEIHVGGPGVARGYLGQPSRTAEVFLPDPFDPCPGARMYATGDLGRQLPDGSLICLGRKDDQVKIRGFRVEPGEVASVLVAHPAVRTATVIVDRSTVDQELVAYVVPEGEPVGLVEELRRLVGLLLPPYMAPADWVLLEALPLTANGKLDRKALPPRKVACRAEELVVRDLPRSHVREILYGLFAEVLGVASVRGGDNFFALGGHSLLATRLISRVREGFGVNLPLRGVFEAPTVDGLAAQVEMLLREENAASPLQMVPRGGALPLSLAQERIWLYEQLHPDTAAFHIPTAVRIRGPLDMAALEGAFAEIVRRHESLRTVFPERDGRPAQEILPPYPVELPIVELSGMEDWEAEARRIVAREVRRPFDLARGPLWRAGVLRAGAEENVVHLTLHHIVSDGWSMTVFVREMAALYTAFANGEPPSLADLPIQYADFAAWQRKRLSGDSLERLLEFWEAELAGA
ncbi:MAG TPA: amino acid adenylation domain-containing protein, partial [Thermoanaerobaculia bacterium]|nr:amino acid adenylation domain-containing protein [Thermoanaerobaculia bacterium]